MRNGETDARPEERKELGRVLGEGYESLYALAGHQW